MIEALWFQHDQNASRDPKIAKLLRVHGWEGYGLYWVVIETLYEQIGRIQPDYEQMAYDWRTTPEKIKSVINDFDLFFFDKGALGSHSIDRRIAEREAIKRGASRAGKASGLARKSKACLTPDEQPLNGRSTTVEQDRERDIQTDRNITAPEKSSFTKSDHGLGLYSPAFLAFWDAYPQQRRGSKAALVQTWNDLRPEGPMLDAIMAGLRHCVQSEAWVNDNGAYVPSVVKWLRERRWEDAADAKKAPSAMPKPKRCECGVDGRTPSVKNKSGRLVCTECRDYELISLGEL